MNSGTDYVVINDWMVDSLGLKGPRLIAYAVIYGFTKNGAGLFVGSIEYIMRWTGMSRRSAYRIVSDLIDDGLIEKGEIVSSGVPKPCYKAVFPLCQNDTTQCQIDTDECQNDTTQCQIDTPIYSYNTNDNTRDNNNYIKRDSRIAEIVSYLNSVLGTNYKPSSKETAKHINARLSEGYSVEDFKTVIDKKAASWQGTDYAAYLRPKTLFGTKFEGYLNELPSKANTAREVARERYSMYDD